MAFSRSVFMKAFTVTMSNTPQYRMLGMTNLGRMYPLQWSEKHGHPLNMPPYRWNTYRTKSELLLSRPGLCGPS